MKPKSKRLLDPRVGFGLAVTALFLWLALRDIDFRSVARIMAGADWPLLLGVSVPCYLGVVYVRARRWRHLTDPIQAIPLSSLFRGAAVGFGVNNLLPLRVGEVFRVWYLGRETGASAPALFGTVVLERIIDTVTVMGLAVLLVTVLGAGSDGLMARVARFLLPVALLPMVVLVCLRLAPEWMLGRAEFVLRPLPARFSDLALKLLRQFVDGLGSLRSGGHLVWIAVDSVVIWLVGSTLPVLAGFRALGLEIGTPFETLVAAWTMLVAVALAVALPSAPGFFGPYHLAARMALEQFGVDKETAVAVGTLVHGVFWVTLTAMGLWALWTRKASLRDLDPSTNPQDRFESR